MPCQPVAFPVFPMTCRMLRYALLLVFLLFTIAATLPFALFQEVVETPTHPLTNLQQYTKQYLDETAEDQWQANADSSHFTAENDLLLYNRQGVKHPIGQVTYRITIDLKEGKYRYTVDSAFFQAYERNRYSRYVPARGASVPYEQAKLTFASKERARYEKQLLEKISSRFQSFQSFVTAQNVAPSPPAAPSEDW